MSLILEALKRSNQERHAEVGSDVPGLDSPAYVERLTPGKNWTVIVPWLVFLAAAALIGFLLFDKYWAAGDRELPLPPPVSVQPEATLVRPSAQPKAQRQDAMERSVGARLAVAEALPEPLPERPSLKVQQKAPADTDAMASRDAAVAALYTKGQDPANKSADQPRARDPVVSRATVETRNPGVETIEQPIDIAQVLARTEQGIKNARLEEHPAPFIAELSQQEKDAIPTILYRNHDYSSDSAQSSVTLNGKRLQVGQSVASGIKLEEILPGSIVLTQRGEPFRLRALNSWVNL